MAKIYRDVLLDKLEALEKLKEQGLISEEKYTKEIATYSKALAEENGPKGGIARAIILLLALSPVIFIGWIIVSALSFDLPEPEPELDLSISSTSEGLRISNNEEGSLTNCTVRVNDKYTVRLPNIIDGKSARGFIAYHGLTTNSGERFNILTHDVMQVSIENCSNAQGRSGLYSF